MSKTQTPTISKQSILVTILGLTTLTFFLCTFFLLFDKLNYSIDSNPFSGKSEVLSIIKRDYLGDNPTPEQIKEGELKGIVFALNDPYSEYLPKRDNEKFEDDLNQRYEGIGVRFDLENGIIVIRQVFSNSPAAKTGLQRGDVLKSVENTEISNSNIEEVVNKIRGPKGSSVNLKIERGSQILDFRIPRESVNTDLIYFEKKEDVGIITISSFGQGLDAKMENIASKIQQDNSIKKLIIDVRSDTGGILDEAIDVISYFLEPNTTILFERNKNKTEEIKSKAKQPSLVRYPLVVLIDKSTASASEILAGALRDQRSAKLIGQKSFGKGVVQRIYNLRNGDFLKITIAQWLTPNKTEIHQKGLEPNISVPESKDELQVALEYYQEADK